jgi:potassium efflux system protein
MVSPRFPAPPAPFPVSIRGASQAAKRCGSCPALPSMTLRRWFLLLLLSVLPSVVHSQFSLPGLQSEASKAGAAAAVVSPRARAEAQLAEARRQQEAGQIEIGATTEVEGLAATDRQRLLDRLVVAYSERLNLLDELENLQKFQPESLTQQALMAEFGEPPPFSALRVDALRDEFDTLGDRLRSLDSAERALEKLKIGRIDAQRRAGEAVRLAEDKLARAGGQQAIDEATLNRELAALRRQLAEAELANIDINREKIGLERKGLQALGTRIERLLARVLPEQRLGKDEVQLQQALLRRELSALTAESDRLVAANNRRAAERERLGKVVMATGRNGPAARQLQLLDARLETDRVLLMTLTWLQTIAQMADDAWEERYLGLNSPQAATRQAAIAALRRNRDDLAGRQQIIDELQQAARTEVREQELRLDGALLDSEATAHESRLLDALSERGLAYQRVDRAETRLQRQLERWLADLGFDDWNLAAGSAFSPAQLLSTMKRVWDFEMFAVEDSTVIDGKTVTVTYGVTVGKSIGALFLFLLGYWLFALLSRRLQHLMVGRFGVNEQVASVIRRWAMITLALVLIIFILNLARIPLAAFAFMGGALAIGIGFGTQTIIKNVISGIIILFERKIRVGDIIALGGMTRHVIAVDLRASTVRGFDGVEALVPNSTFLENQVVNWTYSNPRIRREVRIGVAYGSPVHQAAEIITGCAMDHGQILKDPEPEVFFEDFGDNALLMVLIFWVELGPQLSARRVDSDLRYAMEKRLAAAGIPIPFPQRDVRLDLSQPLAVRITPVADR